MTVNLIQQQDMLKELSDKQLARQMQYPSGNMPLFLVSTEAKRRADLRERFKIAQAEPPEKTTVQEDLLRSILTGETPPTGIAQNLGQRPQTPAIQGRPPQIDPRQAASQPQVGVPPTPGYPQPQMLAQAPVGIMQGRQPQGLPGNIQAPRGFAGGGQVRGFADGVEDDVGGVVRQRYPAVPYGTGSPWGALGKIYDWWKETDPGPAHYFRSATQKDDALKTAPRRPVDPGLVYDPLLGGGSDITGAPPLGSDTSLMPRTSLKLDTSGLDVGQHRTRPPTYAELDYRDTRMAEAAYRNQSPTAPDLRDITATQMDKFPTAPTGTVSYKPVDLVEVPKFDRKAPPKRKEFTQKVDFDKTKQAALDRLNERGDPYAAQSEKLTKREADLEEDRARDPWLALAQAGFTMAGTPGSFSEAAAAGAKEGFGAYVSSKEATDARGDKLFDARGDLTEKGQALILQRETSAEKTADRAVADERYVNKIVHQENEIAQQDNRDYNIKKMDDHQLRLRTLQRQQDVAIENSRLGMEAAKANDQEAARNWRLKIEEIKAKFFNADKAQQLMLLKKQRIYEARVRSFENTMRGYERAADRAGGVVDTQRTRSFELQLEKLRQGALSDTQKHVYAAMKDPVYLGASRKLTGASDKAWLRSANRVTKVFDDLYDEYQGDTNAMRLQFQQQMAASGMDGVQSGALFDDILRRSGMGGQSPAKGKPSVVRKE
jgi:hypothetical protein